MRNRDVTKNNIALLYPQIAAEWAYDLNGDITPDKVFTKASKKYWWRCKKCGCVWNTYVYNRTAGHGCPKCGQEHRRQTVLQKSKERRNRRSIADGNSDIFAEWAEDLNEGLSPTEVDIYSHRRVWWRCSRCGKTWQESARSRFYPTWKEPKRFCLSCRFEDKGICNRQYFSINSFYDPNVPNPLLSDGFSTSILIPRVELESSRIDWVDAWLDGADDEDLFLTPSLPAKQIKPDYDFCLVEDENEGLTSSEKQDRWLDNIRRSANEDLFELPPQIDIALKAEKHSATTFENKSDNIEINQIPQKYRRPPKVWEQNRNKLEAKRQQLIKDRHIDPVENLGYHILWYQCQDCHKEWQKGVAAFRKHRNCPFCDSKNTKVLEPQKGNKNSIAKQRPDLLDFWDFKRNNKNLKFPEWISIQKKDKYWWVCPQCGCERKLSIEEFDTQKDECASCRILAKEKRIEELNRPSKKKRRKTHARAYFNH